MFLIIGCHSDDKGKIYTTRKNGVFNILEFLESLRSLLGRRLFPANINILHLSCHIKKAYEHLENFSPETSLKVCGLLEEKAHELNVKKLVESAYRIGN